MPRQEHQYLVPGTTQSRSQGLPDNTRCKRCHDHFMSEQMASLHEHMEHRENARIHVPLNEGSGLQLNASGRPWRIYKQTSALIASDILQLSKSRHSPQIVESTYASLMQLEASCASARTRVELLSKAVLHRSRLIELSSELPCRRSQLWTALKHDETLVLVMLQEAMHLERNEIMGLRHDAASSFLTLVDSVLCGTVGQGDFTQLQRAPSQLVATLPLKDQLRRVSVRLSMASFQLPKCLYLTGVVLEDPMHVASGGYADIHIGKYLGRRVALKTMRVFAPQQPGEISKSLRTFCREITLLRSLDHPNICGLIGVDRDLFGGRFCLVTDWMLHGNIMDFISANSFVLGEAQQFVIEMASALAYLHSKNVVHGDLHVRNILIDAGRHVRLADFGLSDFSDTSSASMSSADAGAARYMAPEVLLPTKFGLQHVRHTPSSDVHSFAMCVWTIFHGNSPFHDYPVVAASMSILDGLRPSWCTARHDIPEPLWSLLSLCWQQEARHRPSSSDVYSSVSRMFRYSSPPSADSATPAASRRRISRVTSPYQEVDSPESESASSSRPESSSGRSSARQLLRQHRSVQSPTGPPDIARWTIEQALGRHSVRSVRDTAVPRQRALRPLFPIARPSTSPPTMARAPQPPAQTVWHAASQFPGAERLVPQVTYRPSPAQQLSRTLSSQAALMPPAVMFNVQGRHGCGISCAEVFHGRFVELQDPETLIECPRAMVLRIMWPGYEPWSATIMHTETTRKNLAMSVSVHTHVFFNRAVGRCLRQDIRWKLGPGAIAFSDLELVGLQPVGVQDWQAHFRVRSEAPYF